MQKFVPKGEVSKRLFTPVNILMTAGRPFYMGVSMYHAYKGNLKQAAVWAGLAGISDFESPVCATIEKVAPGWGYSEPGAKGDQISDSLALAVAGVGVLANKRVHRLSRLGMAAIMVQEIIKAKQAAQITKEWQAVTNDKSLPTIKSTDPGKRSMADKLTFVGLATTTISETMPFWKRNAIGIGSLAVALQAIREAEVARHEYQDQFYNEVLPAAIVKRQVENELGAPLPAPVLPFEAN